MLRTQVAAADTLVALAEAHIAPALAALAEAHIAPALAAPEEAHIVQALAAVHTALVLAAGRLAELEPPRPPERFARRPRLAWLHRNSCRICYPKRTVCHKRGKTLRLSDLETAFRGFSAKYHSPTAK
jgi:hypothetical protein